MNRRERPYLPESPFGPEFLYLLEGRGGRRFLYFDAGQDEQRRNFPAATITIEGEGDERHFLVVAGEDPAAEEAIRPSGGIHRGAYEVVNSTAKMPGYLSDWARMADEGAEYMWPVRLKPGLVRAFNRPPQDDS